MLTSGVSFDGEPVTAFSRRSSPVRLLAVMALGAAACGGAAAGTASGGLGGAAAAGGNAGAGGRGGATVAAMPMALLVDADQSSNNEDPTFPPSYADALFEVGLTAGGIRYQTLIEPSAGPEQLSFAQLDQVSAVLWYTADATSRLLSDDAQSTLARWLDGGGKTLLIFSENLLADVGAGGQWTAPNGNQFLRAYLGAAGWAADGEQDVGATGPLSLRGRSYTVDGVAGTPLADMHFEVFGNTPLESTADLVNPGPGTVILATTDADPAGTGTNGATPVIVSHAVGTSTVVYAGLPVENIDGAPLNTGGDLIRGILQYTALR